MRFIAFAALLCLSLSAQAATGWIDDRLLVPMRSGPGTQFRIVDSAISSGSRLQILEAGDSWTKVKYNGTVGYIGSQYVTRQPTAAARLSRLQKRYDNLKEDYQSAQQKLQESQQKAASLGSALDSTKNKLASTSESLSQVKQVAANPLKVSQTNRRLNKQLSLLQTELDQVKAQNSLLKHNQTYKGWAFGLGTVILGMIFGAWIKSRGKRSNSGWA